MRFVDGDLNGSFLAKIVKGMGARQRDLVHEIGFGCLLHCPLEYKPSKPVQAWLLRNLNPETSVLFDGMAFETKVDKHVASAVLGLSCNGRKVQAAKGVDYRGIREELSRVLSHGYPKSTLSVNRAKKVLEDFHSAAHLDKENEVSFCVAFMLIAVLSFLAPTAGPRSKVITDDVVHALISINKWNEFDWSDFVVDTLLASARDVRSKCARQSCDTEQIYLSGCTPVLMVSAWCQGAMGGPTADARTPYFVNTKPGYLKCIEDSFIYSRLCYPPIGIAQGSQLGSGRNMVDLTVLKSSSDTDAFSNAPRLEDGAHSPSSRHVECTSGNPVSMSCNAIPDVASTGQHSISNCFGIRFDHTPKCQNEGRAPEHDANSEFSILKHLEPKETDHPNYDRTPSNSANSIQ